MTLEQVAEKAEQMYADYYEAPSMGYEPNYENGYSPVDMAVIKLAEEHGFTFDQVQETMTDRCHEEAARQNCLDNYT